MFSHRLYDSRYILNKGREHCGKPATVIVLHTELWAGVFFSVSTLNCIEHGKDVSPRYLADVTRVSHLTVQLYLCDIQRHLLILPYDIISVSPLSSLFIDLHCYKNILQRKPECKKRLFSIMVQFLLQTCVMMQITHLIFSLNNTFSCSLAVKVLDKHVFGFSDEGFKEKEKKTLFLRKMFLFSKLSFKIGIDHSQNGSHIREVDTQLVYVFLRPYVMSALIKEIATCYIHTIQ